LVGGDNVHAEHVGEDGGGEFCTELEQGSVSAATGVDPEGLESAAETCWVEVLVGVSARK